MSTSFRSLYDVEPLRRRIEELKDFDRLNNGDVDVCVAATDIETGAGVTFSTADGDCIGVSLLFASCGILPEFPAVRIGARLLGDGGLHANVPVRAVISDKFNAELCVVVDVFSAVGKPPRSLEEALARKTEILMANQTMLELASIEREDALCREIRDLMQRLPLGGLDAAESARLKNLARERPRIVRLCYRAPEWEAGPERMYDYGPRTLAYRWQAGLRAADDVSGDV